MALAACDAVNEAIDEIDDIGNDAEVFYYLSLGDSLAVGVQPNGVGAALPTDDGYTDQLFDLIRPAFEPESNLSFDQREEAILAGYLAAKAIMPALLERLR